MIDTTHSTTLTHPDLPGAVFQPQYDTEDPSQPPYWVAHRFNTPGVFCETSYDPPASSPRYYIELKKPNGDMSLEELDDFMATINAYYAAVTRDRAHQPETTTQKGA